MVLNNTVTNVEGAAIMIGHGTGGPTEQPARGEQHRRRRGAVAVGAQAPGLAMASNLYDGSAAFTSGGVEVSFEEFKKLAKDTTSVVGEASATSSPTRGATWGSRSAAARRTSARSRRAASLGSAPSGGARPPSPRSPVAPAPRVGDTASQPFELALSRVVAAGLVLGEQRTQVLKVLVLEPRLERLHQLFGEVLPAEPVDDHAHHSEELSSDPRHVRRGETRDHGIQRRVELVNVERPAARALMERREQLGRGGSGSSVSAMRASAAGRAAEHLGDGQDRHRRHGLTARLAVGLEVLGSIRRGGRGRVANGLDRLARDRRDVRLIHHVATLLLAGAEVSPCVLDRAFHGRVGLVALRGDELVHRVEAVVDGLVRVVDALLGGADGDTRAAITLVGACSMFRFMLELKFDTFVIAVSSSSAPLALASSMALEPLSNRPCAPPTKLPTAPKNPMTYLPEGPHVRAVGTAA